MNPSLVNIFKSLLEYYKSSDLIFDKGRALVKKGRKIVAKIFDRETFYREHGLTNRYSAKYPWALEINGGVRECESLEECLDVLNRYVSESKNLTEIHTLAISSDIDKIRKLVSEYYYGSTISFVKVHSDPDEYEVHNKNGKISGVRVIYHKNRFKFIRD